MLGERKLALVIALHFPQGFVETGPPVCLQRKRQQSLASACGGSFSPVRFGGQSYRIAAISSDFQRDAVGFLCNPDCLAEEAVWR